MKRSDFVKIVGMGTLGLELPVRLTALGEAQMKRPNILFFFPDQHRFDWTSMNPLLPDITPNLKKLAQGGVNFTNAICPSPVCAPSRACLASGKEYARCGVRGNANTYPIDQTTFYSLLKGAGYQVLSCGKLDLDKPAKSWGADGKHKRDGKSSKLNDWGFTDGCDSEGKMDGWAAHNKGKTGPYFTYLKSRNLINAYQINYKLLNHDYEAPGDFPEDAYGDNWVAANGLNLIRSIPAGTPWFLQVNFPGPHNPFDITKSMYDKFKDVKFPGGDTASTDKRRNYAAMINNIDRWIGIYLEEIRKRGELENTIIVYCSDHGEMLGDHGFWAKKRPLQPSASVPLVISGPGVKPGIVCQNPVETLDLTATFLDYAGIKRPDNMDSKTLRPFLEGAGKLERAVAKSSYEGWSLVFDGRYKLISGNLADRVDKVDQGKDLVLYDLVNDPSEMTDVTSKNPDIVAKLKPMLPPVMPKGKSKSRDED
ncbi:MAG TPA: sulfatase-like hydrolase/transferase [Victivallales bacterium]|nr:sulfatase-like hydrolase/transferase [Victivallales bacterium]